MGIFFRLPLARLTRPRRLGRCHHIRRFSLRMCQWVLSQRHSGGRERAGHFSSHSLISPRENTAIRKDNLARPVGYWEEHVLGAPVLTTGEWGPGRVRSSGAASPAVFLKSHTSGWNWCCTFPGLDPSSFHCWSNQRAGINLVDFLRRHHHTPSIFQWVYFLGEQENTNQRKSRGKTSMSLFDLGWNEGARDHGELTAGWSGPASATWLVWGQPGLYGGTVPNENKQKDGVRMMRHGMLQARGSLTTACRWGGFPVVSDQGSCCPRATGLVFSVDFRHSNLILLLCLFLFVPGTPQERRTT